MAAQLECYVYVLLPGSTKFVTAGRFSQSHDRRGQPVGTFVYGRRYRERPDAVELDPVQLKLRQGPFETARLGGAGPRVVSVSPAQGHHSQANRDHNGGSDAPGGRIGKYCQ
jgi:serine/threonine-protein kinase HipA